MSIYKNKHLLVRKMKNTNKGFTLVELSIVIVIIGFLVAGIAAGSNLVKQAQMRSAISDFQSYQTSFNNFKGQYGLPPGDLNNAFSYWGTDCATSLGTFTDEEVCNGDANGIVTTGPTNPNTNTDEVLTAWKHMELAKVLTKSFPDIATPANARPAPFVVGSNIPPSNINSGGYIITGSINLFRLFQPYSEGFGNNTNNFIYLGLPAGQSSLAGEILSPQDAFNLDLKVDDGIIDGDGNFKGFDTGVFRAVRGATFHFAATQGCEDGSTYITTDNNIACVIGYKLD